MNSNELERLQSIRTFPSLVKYLRDDLDWPIESDDFEDLFFEYDSSEFDIDVKTAAKIESIKQLRPFTSNQPWGIFFVKFTPKRLPVVALRRLLGKLVFKQRASGKRSEQATWHKSDLLFISSYGEDEERAITFAHFSESKQKGDLPILRVLGWDKDDTALHLADAHETLKTNLYWPDDEDNIKAWRETWSSAFILRHREVVDTSKNLAIELAGLATDIRQRVNQVLAVEDPEKGPMRKLMAGFKEALIHDLSEDDFADMYAQTIAYGLLAAAISRHVPGEGVALIADNIADMIPVTNPFLKELLGTFLTVGGRKNKLDFDELGINDIIDLLRNANLTAVLHDFGNQNPLEDPVIHFYELFLKEYDAKKRTQRGIFYTPKPVVSFIVRSVHEILKKDFGLKFGLADTMTWGEMAQQQKDLKIPKGIKPDEPFVQILDPATGTGTFLVETIDIIYKTMIKKWENEGHMPLEFSKLWNNYVPSHLLPRLNGFELLMAPYTIAHMKIGLKLKETGYHFQSNERARVYLTNTLEKSKDLSEYLKNLSPALAHEALAANHIKRILPTTVIVGNPPYAVNSANKASDYDSNLSLYKQGLDDERNLKPINDDYIKFLLYSHLSVLRIDVGVIGMITNSSYSSDRLFRQVRKSLLSDFESIYFLDLRGEASRDPMMAKDKNVFDIQQGVGISILIRKRIETENGNVYFSEIVASREEKYNWLLESTVTHKDFISNCPATPHYVFKPMQTGLADEYGRYLAINECFSLGNVGYQTHRDSFVIDFDKSILIERMESFRKAPRNAAMLSETFKVNKSSDWSIVEAHKILQSNKNIDKSVFATLYRPFDLRYICYLPYLIDRDRRDIQKHMLERNNIGLLVSKVHKEHEFTSVFVTRGIVESKVADRTRGAYIFPLMLDTMYASQDGSSQDTMGMCNLRTEVFGFDFDTGSPQKLFGYIYSILHSQSYRKKYCEFLKRDFPRVPATCDKELYKQLSECGNRLISCHLLEYSQLGTSICSYPISGENNITKVGETGKKLREIKNGKGKLFINNTQYFDGVPEEVWNFHVGGYQVCHKWLADRKKAKRKLSTEDIEHYHKIVIAINETIKIMKQLDEVIDAHGGWPDAFILNKS